ncbi:hypothetical protein [Tropicimonas sp. IMCC6043]|uniref:hypothetical protein n=1 Tax=Tropicimonas sp. IMCC6043 TaxID=2510645 RepID=UPI00101BFDFD|nr:hypothetical protein [Tropicimonas sp. IMCC6043]RYH10645.1 hypothetical protein EU800_07855 [Tropicimonas sp. IMCC6043]
MTRLGAEDHHCAMEALRLGLVAIVTLAVIAGLVLLFLRREIRRDATPPPRRPSRHDSTLGKDTATTDNSATKALFYDP